MLLVSTSLVLRRERILLQNGLSGIVVIIPVLTPEAARLSASFISLPPIFKLNSLVFLNVRVVSFDKRIRICPNVVAFMTDLLPLSSHTLLQILLYYL